MSEMKHLNVVRLEQDMSYPFPTILGILSLFIVFTSYSILGIYNRGFNLYLPSGWNSTTVIEEFADSINSMTGTSMVTPLFEGHFIIVILVALLITFNLAQGFTNGQIRTLLSYPISRKKLLVTKSGMVFLVISTSVTISLLLSLVFFFPYSLNVNQLLILLSSFWITLFLITSVCTLIAVLTRSARMTALLNIGVWTGAYTIFMIPSTAQFLRNLLYPYLIAIVVIEPPVALGFLENVSISDVVLGSVCALVLGIVMLGLSIWRFQKMEV